MGEKRGKIRRGQRVGIIIHEKRKQEAHCKRIWRLEQEGLLEDLEEVAHPFYKRNVSRRH